MTDFDMPKTGTWEQRGGWVVRALEKDAGLTIDQASGLVGNLGYESRGFATLQEMKPLVAGSKGGYGWAQWTGPRRRNFEKWCVENALFPYSDEANYGFLLHELLGDFKTFAARLRQMRSVEDACRLTHKEYETPQDVLDGTYRSGPARLTWARRALEGAAATAQASAAEIDGDPIEDIRSAQRKLMAAGLLKKRSGAPATAEDIDGDPGEMTRAAARAWRAAHPGR